MKRLNLQKNKVNKSNKEGTITHSIVLKDRPTFVAFTTAGYPSSDDTVEILLALERGGADVIELGKIIFKREKKSIE